MNPGSPTRPKAFSPLLPCPQITPKPLKIKPLTKRALKLTVEVGEAVTLLPADAVAVVTPLVVVAHRTFLVVLTTVRPAKYVEKSVTKLSPAITDSTRRFKPLHQGLFKPTSLDPTLSRMTDGYLTLPPHIITRSICQDSLEQLPYQGTDEITIGDGSSLPINRHLLR